MRWLNYYEIEVGPDEDLLDAVETLKNAGGGIVRLRPGCYYINNKILKSLFELLGFSKVRIVGKGLKD